MTTCEWEKQELNRMLRSKWKHYMISFTVVAFFSCVFVIPWYCFISIELTVKALEEIAFGSTIRQMIIILYLGFMVLGHIMLYLLTFISIYGAWDTWRSRNLIFAPAMGTLGESYSNWDMKFWSDPRRRIPVSWE